MGCTGFITPHDRLPPLYRCRTVIIMESIKDLENKRDELKKEIEHQKKVRKVQDEIDALEAELDILKNKKPLKVPTPKKSKDDFMDKLEELIKKTKEPCPYDWPYKPLIYKWEVNNKPDQLYVPNHVIY